MMLIYSNSETTVTFILMYTEMHIVGFTIYIYIYIWVCVCVYVCVCVCVCVREQSQRASLLSVSRLWDHLTKMVWWSVRWDVSRVLRTHISDTEHILLINIPSCIKYKYVHVRMRARARVCVCKRTESTS